MAEHLILEKGDNFVGSITLNRPDNLNTFNSPMAGELTEALLDMDADLNVRVIVVKGAGKAFCAGIDVNELADKKSNVCIVQTLEKLAQNNKQGI